MTLSSVRLRHDSMAERERASLRPRMRCDRGNLENALIKRKINTPEGVITTTVDPNSATVSRDGLAKQIYSRLFDWLVNRLNASIGQDTSSDRLIGVLDIYGFESFKTNSFEQLCINFTNEKLQQHFNQNVFKMEQEEYNGEQIDWSYIEFVDNQDVLDLIEKKPGGIIALLDEACMFPKCTHESFSQKLYEKFRNNKIFSKPKLSRTAFTIQHYAGEVTYQSDHFLDKNRGYVVVEHQELLNASKCSFVSGLFPSVLEENTKASKSSIATRFKLDNLYQTILSDPGTEDVAIDFSGGVDEDADSRNPRPRRGRGTRGSSGDGRRGGRGAMGGKSGNGGGGGGNGVDAAAANTTAANTTAATNTASASAPASATAPASPIPPPPASPIPAANNNAAAEENRYQGYRIHGLKRKDFHRAKARYLGIQSPLSMKQFYCILRNPEDFDHLDHPPGMNPLSGRSDVPLPDLVEEWEQRALRTDFLLSENVTVNKRQYTSVHAPGWTKIVYTSSDVADWQVLRYSKVLVPKVSTFGDAIEGLSEKFQEFKIADAATSDGILNLLPSVN